MTRELGVSMARRLGTCFGSVPLLTVLTTELVPYFLISLAYGGFLLLLFLLLPLLLILLLLLLFP